MSTEMATQADGTHCLSSNMQKRLWTCPKRSKQTRCLGSLSTGTETF